MRQYFGAKYNQIQQRSNQKIIQMKKKTYRKIECDKTISSSTESNNAAFKNKSVKEAKPIRKLTKYMKIGGTSSGSTRTKVSTKPSSANRQETHPAFMNQSSLLKQRRGSTMTTCSNNTSRYCSIEDPNRQQMNSKDSIKTFHSMKKPKENESKTCLIIPKRIDDLNRAIFNKSQSKCSLPGNLTMKFSSSNIGVNDTDSCKTQKNNMNNSIILSNADSGAMKGKHIMSTVSIGSQSSTGSSNISTLQNLKEINRLIITKNSNLTRKDMIVQKDKQDNKVYTYKLNELISIIKSTQSSGNSKKQSKKKSSSSKGAVTNYNKKTCRKITKTKRKEIKKPLVKSSVTSKLLGLFDSIYSKVFLFEHQRERMHVRYEEINNE
jgi:hypothetical protein